MLIEFRVTNFRSFRDMQVFSMVAGAGDEHRGTHTFASGASRGDDIIASAAIYGPNAAGKTNLLKAMQCMKSIVVESSSAGPSKQVSYSPFKFDIFTNKSPTKFEMLFVEDGTKYEYSFSIDATRVHYERLVEWKTERPRRVFEREYNIETNEYIWLFPNTFRGNRFVWRDATRINALFLSTAIQLNNIQLLPVFTWFQKRLVPIVGPQQLNMALTLKLLETEEGKDRLLPFIQEADIKISDIEITTSPFLPSFPFPQDSLPLIYQDSPDAPPKTAKVRFAHLMTDGQSVHLNMEDESSGTQLLFRNGGAWINVLTNGEILIIDEVDTSLHPLLVIFLIKRFHSKITNKQNAQIIFTTHNTSLLSLDVFRRDQIWFVDKSPEGVSKIYPLSDFKPRPDENLEKWYLRGRYGALPILDEGIGT